MRPLPSRLLNAAESLRRTPWPVKSCSTGIGAAGVVVNYNTRDLIAALLYSLHRVLPAHALTETVVVDNGSTDGSVPFLERLAEQGLLRLVRNERSTYHGPGLNAGINALAGLQRSGAIDVGVVWVLDSDVIVLRTDALQRSLSLLRNTSAALVGQARHGEDADEPYTLISSLLLDPARVWQKRIRPFWDHGDPGVAMQADVTEWGLARVDFPFYREGYMLHRGRATIRSVAERGITTNRWYRSGVSRGEPHFHGHPQGEAIYAALLASMHDESRGLDPDCFAAALAEEARLVPTDLV